MVVEGRRGGVGCVRHGAQCRRLMKRRGSGEARCCNLLGGRPRRQRSRGQDFGGNKLYPKGVVYNTRRTLTTRRNYERTRKCGMVILFMCAYSGATTTSPYGDP